jgi:opacity protein-like surface antigen
MQKPAAGAGLLFILSSCAYAEGMAGISLGQSLYEDSALAAYFSTQSDTRIDSSGISYKLHGGMPLSSHLSLHAGLYALGNTAIAYTRSITIDNNGTPEQIALDTVKQQLDNRGFFLEGRWQLRPGKAWRPYVKAGMALNTSEFTTTRTPIDSTQTGSTQKETQSSAALVPGIGLVYESLHHWGLQLEFERYLGLKAPDLIPRQDIDNASLGIYGYW